MTQIEFEELIKDGQRSIYEDYKGDLSTLTREALLKASKDNATKATKYIDEGAGRTKVNSYLAKAIANATLALKLS